MATALVFKKTLEMKRDEWLEARRQGIGGSDAAAILGISPWVSAMDVWLEKTGQFTEDVDSENMYWGRVLEDAVAKEFAKRTGLKIKRRNAILQHPVHKFMLANVDRQIIGKREGLEVKTGHEFSTQDWQGKVPEYYYSQVQHYMAVLGFDKWHIAALLGGNKYVQHTVVRDGPYIANLIEKEKAFWELVETGNPPPADGSEACTAAMAKLYPKDDGAEKKLPDDAFVLVQQYDEAKEAEAAAKYRKDEAANKLKEYMGNHKKGHVFDRKITWSNVISNKFDTKAFKEANPTLHSEYCKESSYRRFAIK